MLADFFTKPLQGSLFRHLRARIMNLPYHFSGTVTAVGSQECVGTHSWADVVQSTDGKEQMNQLQPLIPAMLSIL
jgi:hypothetical protein